MSGWLSHGRAVLRAAGAFVGAERPGPGDDVHGADDGRDTVAKHHAAWDRPAASPPAAAL